MATKRIDSSQNATKPLAAFAIANAHKKQGGSTVETPPLQFANEEEKKKAEMINNFSAAAYA